MEAPVVQLMNNLFQMTCRRARFCVTGNDVMKTIRAEAAHLPKSFKAICRLVRDGAAYLPMVACLQYLHLACTRRTPTTDSQYRREREQSVGKYFRPDQWANA